MRIWPSMAIVALLLVYDVSNAGDNGANDVKSLSDYRVEQPWLVAETESARPGVQGIHTNLAISPAVKRSCAIAAIFNPNSPLATYQDFEIAIDPQDPDHNLIYTSNVEPGTPEGTDIYVMRLDGRTGMVSGAPRIIANNYTGRVRVNGPEFTFHPDSGFGVMLAGPSGVHAAWRNSPAVWDAFDFDLYGSPFPAQNPSALPPTFPGRHPNASHHFGLRTYSEIDFHTDTCAEVCYASLNDGTTTDLKLSLEATSQFQLYRSSLHPTADGYVVFTGCLIPLTKPSDCGIFEVQIDGSGGVMRRTFMQLYETDKIPPKKSESITTSVHPVTGNIIVSVLHGLVLTVWESESPHTNLSLVGQLTDLPTGNTENPEHLRLIEGKSEMYLQFFVRDGDNMGSYASMFDDSIHPLQQIDNRDPGGSELLYLPAADRLALFSGITGTLPNGDEVQMVERCWIGL
jgi:hypothetical protein